MTHDGLYRMGGTVERHGRSGQDLEPTNPGRAERTGARLMPTAPRKRPAKTAAAPPERGQLVTPDSVPPTADPAGQPDQVTVSAWEFVDTVPSWDDVLRLMETLPDVWGVHQADYVDYVVGLPSPKTVKVPREKGSTILIDQHHNVVTLYMSVAGRVAQLREAQEKHGWRVRFKPEPKTPTGIPGYVRSDDERIVYREYVIITDSQGVEIGRRHGTAWVPTSGGRQAAKSNPYEKVETSATGRALGRWGFGVLPGSGIASLEEMMGVRDNQAGMAAETVPAGEEARPMTDLAAEGMELWNKYAELRHQDRDAMLLAIADHCKRSYRVDVAMERDEVGVPREIDLTRLRKGMVVMMNASLRRWIADLAPPEKGPEGS